MKRKISALLLVFITVFAFCKPKEKIIQPDELEKVIEQHPLVEKARIYEAYCDSLWKAIFYKSIGKEPNCSYTFDLDLTLTNGHTVIFKSIPNSLSFHKCGRLQQINNVQFASVDHKKKSSNGSIYLKDFCKATDTNYFNLYSILDNYIDFCKLLNSVPWILDEKAEKLCARYSDEDYVDLYRSLCSTYNPENNFIEIPED